MSGARTGICNSCGARTVKIKKVWRHAHDRSSVCGKRRRPVQPKQSPGRRRRSPLRFIGR